MEESTEKAVARDYATAWQAMAEALEQNRADLLAGNFVGSARRSSPPPSRSNKKPACTSGYVDKGHNVQAIFYSPKARRWRCMTPPNYRFKLMDGTKVIRSEDATVHYVALLTAAENSWKVRVLEAVPSF